MEKKPIKRNKNIVPISREHHATLLFCWKLRSGVKEKIDTQRITKYVNWFWKNHMETHFETEEKLLFVDFKDEMVNCALKEHQLIISKINEINLESAENAYKLYTELADLVDDHTRYEERQLFPYLEKKFSENELQKIGEILNNEELSAKEDYEDEFWKK